MRPRREVRLDDGGDQAAARDAGVHALRAVRPLPPVESVHRLRVGARLGGERDGHCVAKVVSLQQGSRVAGVTGTASPK